MAENLERIVGPRVSAEELRTHRSRYLIPTILFVIAAGLLIASIFQPYWRLTLHAPQYPKGLHVIASLSTLEGDVAEIDGLNHYIGIAALVLLILAAIFIHNKWVTLLALPALLFPVIFLADLQYWMANFGQNLNPSAPLSSSVKPFIPPVLFEGKIAQFSTWAQPELGLWMAIAASIVILIGLYFHRRAYKPLVDATSGK